MKSIEDPKLVFTKPLRILIVEDNQVDQHMLESMLTDSTKTTSFLKTANSLAQATELLDKNLFDVVLLDLNLPDSLGNETLKTITMNYPRTAVVVNTGAYEEDVGLGALGEGAQDFLVKGKYNAYVLVKVLHYAIERKKLEMDLKEAYMKLKATQTQLIQAEKLKVIGGLASGVAHEVKNPLATILYGCTYLSEELSGKDQKIDQVLETINEAVTRASGIITELLDYSSLQKLKKTKENINDIFEKVSHFLSHQIQKAQITIETKYAENIPKILLDRNKMEQVFINLILNALKASPKGGSIKFESEYKKTDNLIVIRLIDSGCGITEDKINNIFDPFYTTHRADGGIGLGLSVVKNIIDLHKASIVIQNNKKTGVTVTLSFDVPEGEEDD